MYYLFSDTTAPLTLRLFASGQRLQMILVFSRQLGIDAIRKFIQSGPDLTTDTMHVHCWRLYST